MKALSIADAVALQRFSQFYMQTVFGVAGANLLRAVLTSWLWIVIARTLESSALKEDVCQEGVFGFALLS